MSGKLLVLCNSTFHPVDIPEAWRNQTGVEIIQTPAGILPPELRMDCLNEIERILVVGTDSKYLKQYQEIIESGAASKPFEYWLSENIPTGSVRDNAAMAGIGIGESCKRAQILVMHRITQDTSWVPHACRINGTWIYDSADLNLDVPWMQDVLQMPQEIGEENGNRLVLNTTTHPLWLNDETRTEFYGEVFTWQPWNEWLDPILEYRAKTFGPDGRVIVVSVANQTVVSQTRLLHLGFQVHQIDNVTI